MFNEPAISTRELELETAELLPSRETLCVSRMQWFPHRRFFGGWGGWGGFGAPFGFGDCDDQFSTFGFGGWGGVEGFGFGGCDF